MTRIIALTVALVLALTAGAQAQAKSLEEATYADVFAGDARSESYRKGIVVGAFTVAEVACPAEVSSGIVRAHMERRIAQGVSKTTDPWLRVFYFSVFDAGCKVREKTQQGAKIDPKVGA